MILAIETSCDETAAAVVTRDGELRSSVVSSQADLHARFGGVVPEVASRRHLELIGPVIREALAEAEVDLGQIERVAVTQGPGLVGALLVGLAAAKAIAWARRLPLVLVDHLHGHVSSLFLRPEQVEPPFLCLLASGGHTLLLEMQDHRRWRQLGTTLDDAAGEAFDKGARLLGLPYPGGAGLDRLAASGDPGAYRFPIARVPGLDFSFSGLKTALLYAVRELAPAELELRRADLA
ncbi:MAG: tRNA (adenosine(37)-N6)-threonylcarbamoyltransferase complex transferase subunit TsaD, partial [Gaiellaceae bacterium]